MRQLRVIAQLRMGIQGQVPTIEIDIVGQQGFQATALHAADHWRFVFPEIAVMNNHRIRLQTDGLIQQRLAGRHSGDDLVHRFASFHLQTVRGEVTDGRTIELVVNQLSSSLFFIATPADNQVIQRHNITISIRVVDSPLPSLTMTF
ncbi:Uncharacterised protein [Klebsiella pneumoniae]|uniref:Uncharacterized protein n=1 Tax=Klebsiella pneumoniae TaxID=573 RepID=A0A2X3EPP2_KLEPN|nr:Uncharacterised protein [Klebsiella pneumoniae]